jgi:hypothetical protein
LALDRGDELHLLQGLPSEWTGPGMVTRLNKIATPFGPLDLTLMVNHDGRSATLSVNKLGANCKTIIVHLPEGGTRTISPKHAATITFPMAQQWRLRS